MKYSDFLAKIIFLTKRNNISQSEIGEAIGLDRAAANARAQRDSKFKPDEIEKIEKYFGINLTDISITNNSGAAINDETICLKTEDFGKRLHALQEKNDYTDRKMAKILGIYEDEYLDLNVPNIKN